MKTHFKLYVRETSISFTRDKRLKVSKYEYIFLTDIENSMIRISRALLYLNICVLFQLNPYSKIEHGNEYARRKFADYRYLCL